VTGTRVRSNVEWFDNDALFRSELTTGHRWAQFVHDALAAHDLPVTLTPMQWRASIDDRHDFADEVDLVVGDGDDPIIIECKSRRLRFGGSPTSYPYPTALVDTVYGWERKHPTPRAVVLVSQFTEHMLVVPVEASRNDWTVKSARDRVRGINEQWFECPSDRLWTFGDLVERLRLSVPTR
jgi:hypothetical protein